MVNMGLVVAGSAIIPAPPGVDLSDAESLAGSIHLFATIFMIPAPIVFIVADLMLAYAPMALLALWVLKRFFRKSDGADQPSVS